MMNNNKNSKNNKTQSFKKYNLPKDTLNLVTKISIDNKNLFFNKLVEFSKIKSEYKAVLRNFYFNEDLIDKINKIRENLLNNLKHSNYNIVRKKLKVDGKLCIGLGQASVYEISINLDHIYGVPFIPASSIKGVVRSWINQNTYSDNLLDELGNQNSRGKVMFLDAYPVRNVNVELDIMAPHFSDYYSSKGKNKPTDDQNINIIKFPVIKNSTFEFSILSKKLKENQLDKWMNILEEALKFNGIGAKTSLGYGYFKSEEKKRIIQEDLQALCRKFNSKKDVRS